MTTKSRPKKVAATSKTTKKTAVRVKKTAKTSNKVDYYPNRVPFYVALIAATSLLLLAFIASYSSI